MDGKVLHSEMPRIIKGYKVWKYSKDYVNQMELLYKTKKDDQVKKKVCDIIEDFINTPEYEIGTNLAIVCSLASL